MIYSDAQPVQFWLSRLDTFNEKEVGGVFSKCFCQPFEADDEITIQFNDVTGITRKLEIFDSQGSLYNTTFTETASGFYQLSIIPRNIGITDNEIQLKITDGISLVLAKSDCLSIKESHDETVLINYHNNRIFASLSSAIGTPDPEFNVRIPAVFFEERFPEESEVMELSTSESVQLNAQVTAQKYLNIGPMPFYMHRKMKLVLKFQNVTIEDQQWVMKEAYEIRTSRRTNPLRQATVWLNQKDYVLRNVL